ncbi:hypothetical protein FSPOR_6099 [Fusarium sporotrichioides]|uniref:NACHT domain-containing protein n=1 Tax=Fusarium sporotrichioides TaxID=5514 RepID=A0A395S5K8_FUSSP|nr:hypothetical protein FSPOR_6099 [Fusarium sporotrichioides]
MATGLEAAGAASAVISFITFTGKIVSLSHKIYNGVTTDEQELEDYAGRMLDAFERVRLSNQKLHHGMPAEAKLSEIAGKCVQLAGELQKETQSIIKRYQKGKVRRAVSIALRATAQNAKIKELDQSLQRYMQVMVTELHFATYDKSTAIEKQQSQAFPKLERDVQDLISSIASDQAKVQMLLTSLATHIKASETRAITDNQRQRLLKSLKPEEIRMRYNEVMSPSDASFERVFASYKRVCRNNPEHKDREKIKRGLSVEMEKIRYDDADEIDRTWHSFSRWLQSDNTLFWIQGKPGSGKSTLMKFIIENENTERLLNSWSPNTRILSYFLWKIGKESQNSVKGLLCCLLHDLLIGDCDLLDQALETFPFLTMMDFYQEWSSEEAEKVLDFLLNSQTYSTCIFVDGLDEIRDKDGFELLTSVLQRMSTIPKVKLCVSSRLETGLKRALKAMKAQELRLHDLTRPEMANYTQKQLARFPELVSASLRQKITRVLLDKSQGVFLWLFLANKSLITGINNGDDEDILMERLEELPSELETLYETMWSKLNASNKVYRETAAKYFHCIIANTWHFGGMQTPTAPKLRSRRPTLAQLSIVVKVAEDRIFPPRPNNISCYELKRLCDVTERDLDIRCAGMLQVSEKSVCHPYITQNSLEDLTAEIYPFTRSVQFIHRTARDFLVDTKPGQDILSYYSGMKTTIDLELKIFKSELYLSTLYRTLGVEAIPESASEGCFKLQNKGADDETILQLLRVIRDLWNQGVFIPLCVTDWFPFYSFPASFPCWLSNMEDFCLSWMMQSSSCQDSTVALRDICLEWKVSGEAPPTQMIQRLIALGADPHAIGATTMMESPINGTSFTQGKSAFELLLRSTFSRLFSGDYYALPAALEVLDSMAPICSDLHRRIIVTITENQLGTSCLRDIENWEYHPSQYGWATFEVDILYLLRRLLAAIEFCGIPTQAYKVYEIANLAAESYSRIRHVAPRACNNVNDPFRALNQIKNESLFCYRIIDQEPFKHMCDDTFRSRECTEWSLLRLMEGILNRDPDFEFLLRNCKLVLLGDEIVKLASEDLGIHILVDGEVDDQLDTGTMEVQLLIRN